MTLRTRWLGRVPYREAWALQRALHARSPDDHLLLLEHPHVYTLGVRADLRHVLVPPADVGRRPGAHRPGRRRHLPRAGPAGRLPDRVAAGEAGRRTRHGRHRRLRALGRAAAHRRAGRPRAARRRAARELPRACGSTPTATTPARSPPSACGSTRGRSMHGFALNVGARHALLGLHRAVRHPRQAGDVAGRRGHRRHDARRRRRGRRPGGGAVGRAGDGERRRRPARRRVAPPARRPVGVQPRRGPRPDDLGHGPDGGRAGGRGRAGAGVPVRLQGRLAEAGVTDGLRIAERKPEWLRSTFRTDPSYLRLKHTMRDLGLVTVCEEAGCPNISECWADGTATFMINGERCTRACGFCLVDTRHPEAARPRRARAGGRGRRAHGPRLRRRHRRRPRRPGRRRRRRVRRHDRGHPAPHAGRAGRGADPRLQGRRGVAGARSSTPGPTCSTTTSRPWPGCSGRCGPSAGYARSLAVLARAKEAGLTTKSGLIVGMGETDDEVVSTLADLRAVGVDIVTIGQYLRPTTHHLPVARWVEPADVRRPARRRARRWASPTSSRARSPGRATTPARRPRPSPPRRAAWPVRRR